MLTKGTVELSEFFTSVEKSEKALNSVTIKEISSANHM